MGLVQAHPGNGIAVLPDGSVITGDAVGNSVWRFKAGAPPEQILANFHCHWVTLGKDGHVYGEVQTNVDGRWETTIHRIDLKGKRSKPVLKGTTSLSVFLVDKDSSIIALLDGSLQRNVGGVWSPFRGNGRPADTELEIGVDRAMAWGPNGEVFVLAENRLWAAGNDGRLHVKTAFQGTAYGLYAAPGQKVQPWGFAVDASNRPIIADPSTEQVYRMESKDRSETLDLTHHDWAALNVAIHAGRTYLVEVKSVGNRTLGPRVAVVDKTGTKKILGTVGPKD